LSSSGLRGPSNFTLQQAAEKMTIQQDRRLNLVFGRFIEKPPS